jgi:hypothetical protein
VAAELTRQSQLHRLPWLSKATGRRRPIPGPQARFRNVPRNAIRIRFDIVHGMSHKSRHDIEDAPKKLNAESNGQSHLRHCSRQSPNLTSKLSFVNYFALQRYLAY